MKKLSIIIFLMIIITACKRKGDENVKFAPPVAKADMELAKPAAKTGMVHQITLRQIKMTTTELRLGMRMQGRTIR